MRKGITPDEHTLATICTRYAELRASVKDGLNALSAIRQKTFDETITPSDKQLLRDFEKLLSRLHDQHGQIEAVKYFEQNILN